MNYNSFISTIKQNQVKRFSYTNDKQFKSDLNQFKNKGGVYIVFNKKQDDEIIYIGESKDLYERLTTHFGVCSQYKSALNKALSTKGGIKDTVNKYVRTNLSFCIILCGNHKQIETYIVSMLKANKCKILNSDKRIYSQYSNNSAFDKIIKTKIFK